VRSLRDLRLPHSVRNVSEVSRRALCGSETRSHPCGRWREKNGAEYNARRRREYREANPLSTRPCVVCGRPMTRPANTLVCGKECRRQRKLEQRQALRCTAVDAANESLRPS
jgi:hypothetical protein